MLMLSSTADHDAPTYLRLRRVHLLELAADGFRLRGGDGFREEHVGLALVLLLRANALLWLDTFEELSEVLETYDDNAEVIHGFELHSERHHLVNGLADDLRDVLERALVVSG